MRLSVFIANQPSPQLVIDLQKIYLDLSPKAALTEQSIVQTLLEKNTRLFMTMFNERHIGAVKVVTDTSKAVLSQLCIREITRRRGIGKNLLKQIEKQLAKETMKEVEYNLQEVSESELKATQLFLVDSGYTINENIASKLIA